MKGIVFTELLEMVEERYSLDVVDRIVERAQLPSGGVYTSVGTYPPAEAISLVRELSKETGASASELLHTFGLHLFKRFAVGFPHFFRPEDDTLGFLERVETVIHVEVKKLYPDAELPTFDCMRNDGALTMIYRSPRCLSSLAEGLIQGCADHFGEPIAIAREDLSKDASGEVVRFTITKRAAA